MAESGEEGEKKLFRRGLLVVLSGPSGVGKNTLLNLLLARMAGIRYSISATTRPPRAGERDGVDYFFFEPEKFLAMADAGELLEWAHFCGHYYGTPRSYVEGSIARGTDVILDIDTQGAVQLKKKLPEGVFVFLMPPSWQALEQRIRGRGKDTEESIKERLNRAREEIDHLSDYQYVILNDDLERAVGDLEAIILAERCKVVRNDVTGFLAAFFAKN